MCIHNIMLAACKGSASSFISCYLPLRASLILFAPGIYLIHYRWFPFKLSRLYTVLGHGFIELPTVFVRYITYDVPYDRVENILVTL